MHIDPAECHPSMDYSEHQRTYKLFLKLALYTVIGVAALLVLLAHYTMDVFAGGVTALCAAQLADRVCRTN